jgi:hypothetical protein
MMEKKILTKEEQAITWLKSEIEKDKLDLEKEKKRFIESIKELEVNQIVEPKKKLTLWEKIKKVILA